MVASESTGRGVSGAARAILRSWRLRRLARERGTLAAPVAAALRSALRDAATPEERGWFARIEQLRAELNASDASVMRLDYGAGNPGAGIRKRAWEWGESAQPDGAGANSSN